MTHFDDLQFDPEGWRYWVERDGEQVNLISTTTLIRELGLIDTTWFRPHHMQAGSDRHLVVEMWSRGDLYAVDALLLAKPELEPSLDAWKAFCDETGFKVEHVEVGVYSLGDESRCGFAGRVDAIGTTWKGRAIVDVKGRAKMPSYALQLHAYFEAWSEAPGPDVEVAQLLSVHLNSPKPGRYALVAYENDERARKAWAALRAIKIWKDGGLFNDGVAGAIADLAEWWGKK